MNTYELPKKHNVKYTVLCAFVKQKAETLGTELDHVFF